MIPLSPLYNKEHVYGTRPPSVALLLTFGSDGPRHVQVEVPPPGVLHGGVHGGLHVLDRLVVIACMHVGGTRSLGRVSVCLCVLA